MRWRLGPDHRACTTCGAELDPDAVWCGSCGAAVTAREPAAALPLQPPDPRDGPADGRAQTSPRQRFVWVVAVAALAALVIAVLRPDRPPAPLLGRVDALAGVSATGPPPDGLRLAWEVARPSVAAGHDLPNGDVVAAAGMVRVGETVVDAGSGRVLRQATAAGGGARHRVVHTGDELVVVDTLTGTVTSRSALSVGPGAPPLVTLARSGDVTLLGGDGHSLMVRDDGTVVTELAGTMAPQDRAVLDAAAFPVRGDDENTVELVAVASGEVVADLAAPSGHLLAVDVVGDLALVATTSRELPGPETGVPWMVRLVDAGTGQEQRQLVMQSAEPPRLLGFLDDGTTVLSTRSGREIAVRSIGPDGRLGPLAQVTTAVRSVVDAPAAAGSALLATVGVSGGVAVGLDARRGLLGFSRRGNVVWQVDAEGAAVLAFGDGYVAVVPEDFGEHVRVRDATDGSAVATISPADAAVRIGERPLAVLDGHVGLALALGSPLGDPRVRLGETTWHDLRTGELIPMAELFAPHTGGEPSEVGADWSLHGVTAGPGGTEPVISHTQTRSVIQLLEPGEGFTTFELPDQDAAAVAGFLANPVGATATRLAVWTRDFEDPAAMATHVLDRTTGTVTTAPDLVGIALVGDLLLAVEVDGESDDVTALVGVDAATGEQRWTGDPIAVRWPSAPPRLDRDLLVVRGSLEVEAVSLRDGTRPWTHSSDVELSEHLVLGPRLVVVAATDGEVIALDRDDGSVAWRTPVGAPVTSMAGAGGDILVGTVDGLVVHLDRRGREVQRVAVATEPVHAVAALGEAVVATMPGRVTGLRADGPGITRQDEVELP